MSLIQFARGIVALEILARLVGPAGHGPYLIPLTMAEPDPLDASGYFRGLAELLGGSTSASLPIPDDDEAPAEPADDAP